MCPFTNHVDWANPAHPLALATGQELTDLPLIKSVLVNLRFESHGVVPHRLQLRPRLEPDFVVSDYAAPFLPR